MNNIESLIKIVKQGNCSGIHCYDCYFDENGDCEEVYITGDCSELKSLASKILRELKLKRVLNGKI